MKRNKRKRKPGECPRFKSLPQKIAKKEKAEVQKLQALVDKDVIDLVTEGVLPLSIVDNKDLHQIMSSKLCVFLCRIKSKYCYKII